MIGAAQLVARLRALVAGSEALREYGASPPLPVIRMLRTEPRFDWAELAQLPSSALPGLPVGQQSDRRYATDGTEGLHLQYFAAWVDAHLDDVDAVRSPLSHLAADTSLLPGALLGGVLAAAMGAAAAHRGTSLALFASGAFLGGVLGAQRPRRARQVIPFAVAFPF